MQGAAAPQFALQRSPPAPAPAGGGPWASLQGAAVPQPVPPQPPPAGAAGGKGGPAALHGPEAARALAAGAPAQCLADPFCELRTWDGASFWPYCTGCSAWSDMSHLSSTRHLKRLAGAGLGPIIPEAAAAAPALPTKAAPPMVPWMTPVPQRPPAPAAPHEPRPWSALGVQLAPSPPPPTAEEIYDWSLWTEAEWLSDDPKSEGAGAAEELAETHEAIQPGAR
ncbi:unnamed protein product [Prorocentrum cordatum]|uniref:Uncharacterized protein n=1 Tax=Prorocentrum cordatum TaxID=2364126 RepID=A0ABN9R489_9DINO|nr:unnamed protein product [Polarella glacialis]